MAHRPTLGKELRRAVSDLLERGRLNELPLGFFESEVDLLSGRRGSHLGGSHIELGSRLERPIARGAIEILVEAPQERAFRVFTEKFDAWWPREHHIGTAEMKTAMLECKPGGRFYEQGVDGSECEWGKVLVWEPPRRLVLAWQINAEWKYDPSIVCEVEVSFTAEGPKRTRVELEHRNLERLGAAAAATRGMLDSGWGKIMPMFARIAEG